MHGTPSPPSPEELARRLLVAESVTHHSTEEEFLAAVHTYEQLRIYLSAFFGLAGFDALWARSLYLVRQTVPWDDTAVASQPPPSLHRLDAVARGRDAAEMYTVFLAIFTQFLATLFTFIGADLGFRLLQQHWSALSMSNRKYSARLANPSDAISNEKLLHDASDEHVTSELQAVNEQLLVAGLRDRVWTDELHNQLAFTRAATRSISEGVFALDHTGLVTLVNLAAEQMLGWTEAELQGKRINEMIPLHTPHGLQAMWEPAFLHGAINNEANYQNVDVVITRRDGSAFAALYSAAPIVINELVAGVVISFRDMTEMQRLRQTQEAHIRLLSEQQTTLEEQARARTSELERINITLQAEISKRHRSEQARQYLLAQLVSAQEEERRRIARELHDQMGQHVTALMIAIKVVQNRMPDDARLQQPMTDLHTLGSQIGHDVRTLAVQLRPPALDDFGLLPTLTTYIEQWSIQALVAADLFTTGLKDTRLPQMIETTVFRVVQEALTNIMRHAQATSVSVIMHRRADVLHVIVEDDGVGFDAEFERNRPYAERRFGLLGIEERVALLAGTLTIESTLGSGTTVFVSLPLTS